MRRRHGISIFGVLAALAVVGVAVQATSAASGSTIDGTYSCSVSNQRQVTLFGSVTLPPANGRSQPGVFAMTTGTKSVTKNGATTTQSQVGFGARKNSLKIDKSSCHSVNKQIPLKSKGLSGPPSTATPSEFGHVDLTCPATSRVLIHFRLTIKAGAPAHALVAVRNQKNKPVAFYNWNPRKIAAYSANGCVEN